MRKGWGISSPVRVLYINFISQGRYHNYGIRRTRLYRTQRYSPYDCHRHRRRCRCHYVVVFSQSVCMSVVKRLQHHRINHYQTSYRSWLNVCEDQPSTGTDPQTIARLQPPPWTFKNKIFTLACIYGGYILLVSCLGFQVYKPRPGFNLLRITRSQGSHYVPSVTPPQSLQHWMDFAQTSCICPLHSHRRK